MKSRTKHFYSLDNLRGVAALIVVCYHWVNFHYDGRNPFHGDPHQLPLYSILWPIYEEGLLAVDLFFCLSGFIFYWLYAQKIADEKVSFKQFILLRFSRLYPLHFLTLIAAAVATFVIRHMDGSFWGDYGYNDWYHFILQLGFMSNWGWEKGFSFNCPIWSVSVEIWLYLMFFSLCRLKLTNWKLLICYALIGLLLKQSHSWLIGKGIFCFFIGGLAFKVFQKLQSENKIIPVKTIALALIGLWVVLPINFSRNLTYHAWCHVTSAPNDYGIGGTIVFFTTYSYDLLLFPATIVLLALWETQRGTLGKRLAFLGDISYASYLLHFPLQLLIIITAIHWAWPKDIFASPITLLFFFGLLIAVSLASHKWFEKPVQNWLRHKLLPQKKSGGD